MEQEGVSFCLVAKIHQESKDIAHFLPGGPGHLDKWIFSGDRRAMYGEKMLAILDDKLLLYMDTVKRIKRVVRCYENANKTSRYLNIDEETKRNLVSTRTSYVLYTSFSFWVRCTIATRKVIFLQGM